MTQNTLSSFVIALLIFLGSLGAYTVWYNTVTSMSTRVAELSALIQAKTDESSKLLSARKLLETLEGEGIIFERYFVPQDDIVPFLSGLENTGRSLGSHVEVLSVSPQSAGDGRLTVNLAIEGNLNSVLRTLGAIEYGPYDIVSTKFSLERRETDDVAPWQATVAFSVGSSLTPEVVETPGTAEETNDI